MKSTLNAEIMKRGKSFFSSIRGEKPSVFNKERWVGKIMDKIMESEDFKVQMFRFVDVFPYLSTSDLLTHHIREYFGGEDQDVPSVLKWGANMAGLGGKIGGAVLNKAIRYNIQDMAKQFIVGEQTTEAMKNIGKLRADGFACVVDILGEATVNEEEAEAYLDAYLGLLKAMREAAPKWKPLAGASNDLDWGHTPKINVAVKPTSLYSQTKPVDFEGSVQVIADRIARVYEKVIEAKGFLCIDMESTRYKNITIEVFKRLRLKYRDYPHLGIVLQAYLRDTDCDLQELIAWARQQKVQISVRLVKGAYWDYETVVAKQNGWPVPVYTIKAETDASYERNAQQILENHDVCHFACASHNIRTISAVMEMANELKVPEERYEFQVLYGMAEPVRRGLLNVAKRIRLYSPYGDMVPGMGYLVRRLLENTANESFLRQSFHDDADAELLLEDPEKTLRRLEAEHAAKPVKSPAKGPGGLPPFHNEPAVDFTIEQTRQAFKNAIADVRGKLGRTYPLFINGKEVLTDDRLASVNPANPKEQIGTVCQAGKEEVARAIAAAKAAFPVWRDTPPRERAEYLIQAAAIARRRLIELSAWQVLEVGKQWDQAYADVTEAIDFLEYNAREMVRLGAPQRVGSAPGEVNLYSYEPKGLASVISPWNFPLAIACGMVSAALVTGNCVMFKPAGVSPVVGWNLVEILREAGLPQGVFNFVPGRGSVIGDYMVEHPDISLIAFTGSVEVGLRIVEKAAKVHPGQPNVKKIISEMGGKNAIIIDDDADLDEAVPHVLYSAFAFQGQKCSACSRVIVLDAIYDHFIERLVKGAQAMPLGPSENPLNAMGPVVDASAKKTIEEYIRIGKSEGKVLFESVVPSDGGYYVPIVILGDIRPEHRIAQEEVFGPVLSIMRVKDIDQAIEWANSTRFALTGGFFSRSPKNLARVSREFRVGNLYLNRNCTGALVGRQPFGGARMSGVGTKAGGPDYLLHFMDPRVVTENTVRRGFTPIAADDDWFE